MVRLPVLKPLLGVVMLVMPLVLVLVLLETLVLAKDWVVKEDRTRENKNKIGRAHV